MSTSSRFHWPEGSHFADVEKPLDYLHVSLFDIHSETRDGKYAGIERVELLHKWIGGRMPLIGIGSIFTPDQALEAIEVVGKNCLLEAASINCEACVLIEAIPQRWAPHCALVD